MGNLFTWKLHGDGKTLAPGEVVEPDERLTWTRTIGIADFTFAFQGVQFNGIAIGTVVILVAYHGLKAIGKVTGTIDKDDPDIL